MLDLVWIALAGLVQPAGGLEIVAVVTVVLLAGLCALLLATACGSVVRPVPLRARAGARAFPRSSNWDADAPGRPQPRAPGCRRTVG